MRATGAEQAAVGEEYAVAGFQHVGIEAPDGRHLGVLAELCAEQPHEGRQVDGGEHQHAGTAHRAHHAGGEPELQVLEGVHVVDAGLGPRLDQALAPGDVEARDDDADGRRQGNNGHPDPG